MFSIIYKGLEFEVKVLKSKRAYGKKRYLITPVAGNGETWVEKIKAVGISSE
tara:strand:+ start:113 stop:268 length:156 start_codon:yes stop_codon:yes gene_type:complete